MSAISLTATELRTSLVVRFVPFASFCVAARRSDYSVENFIEKASRFYEQSGGQVRPPLRLRCTSGGGSGELEVGMVTSRRCRGGTRHDKFARNFLKTPIGALVPTLFTRRYVVMMSRNH